MLFKMNFDPYLSDYKEAVSQISYKPNGMFYSEGFLLVSFCRHYDVEIILESGTCQGMSTELMARSLSDTQIYTFDNEFSVRNPKNEANYEVLDETRNRLNSLGNVIALIGDGRIKIPQIVEANPMKRIAVVVDGPKGWRANDLASYCLGLANVKFVGIHDQYDAKIGVHREGVSVGRAAALATTPTPKTYCTHTDGSFATKYRFLDEDYLVKKDYMERYPKGPGLCIYYKDEI